MKTVLVASHGARSRGPHLRDALTAHQPFANSSKSFRGEPTTMVSGHFVHAGRLQGAELEALHATKVINYVVYSYGTPIAWQTPDGWHVVDDRFSSTTTRHQGVLRSALRELT